MRGLELRAVNKHIKNHKYNEMQLIMLCVHELLITILLSYLFLNRSYIMTTTLDAQLIMGLISFTSNIT